MNQTIPSSIVDQAIAWSVTLNFNNPDDATRAAFERWRLAATLHDQAWSRVQSLSGDFATVPRGLALDALSNMNGARAARLHQRRAVLKSLVIGGGLLGTGWIAHDHTPWQRALADISTHVGQRDQTTLADGTRLALNTDSAVSVNMTGAERIVVLYRGEISVDTGNDNAFSVKRPFFVHTPYGVVQALGTRFVVRLEDDRALVSVQQDAVELRPKKEGIPVIAHAGQDWLLDRYKATHIAEPNMEPDAWLQGAIVGTDMRLSDLIAQMSRYRHGRISCTPEVANLRVSGTYHVNDIDQSLRFLAQTNPIRLRYWTRYWITVGPA